MYSSGTPATEQATPRQQYSGVEPGLVVLSISLLKAPAPCV